MMAVTASNGMSTFYVVAITACTPE